METINSDLKIQGDLEINKNIQANGNAYVFGTLEVGGSLKTNSLDIEKGFTSKGALTVLPSGFVGIGTSNPTQELTVVRNDDKHADLRIHNKSGHSLDVFSGTTRAGIWSYGPRSLEFATQAKERMKITPDGKVGIGVTNPQVQLHTTAAIINSVTIGTKPSPAINYPWPYESIGVSKANHNLRLQSPGYIVFHAGVNSNEEANKSKTPLVIHKDGRVGIGGSPAQQAKLHVRGKVKNKNFTSYGFLNHKGRVGFWEGNNNNPGVSIWADDRIVSTEYMAKSDRRIKENIQASDSSEDLEILKKIQIVNYKYKDKVQTDDRVYKKVIGQQIADIYPQAVQTNHVTIIPNILKYSSIKKGWLLLSNHELNKGDVIQLVFENGIEEVAVLESKKGKIQLDIDKEGKVFVYGSKVKDFHVVDYEALAMLNISATQELLYLIDQQAKDLEKMKNKMQQLIPNTSRSKKAYNA